MRLAANRFACHITLRTSSPGPATMKIPQLLLRQLYTFGSLTNAADGARFSLKNRDRKSVV